MTRLSHTQRVFSLTESRWYGYVVGAVAVVGLYFIIQHFFLTPPEKALYTFYTAESNEQTDLIDPLILAGRRVVPLLLKEIIRRDMPRRRHAIAALGNLGDWRAMPALEAILHDQTEQDFFRADALEAIALIDKDVGRYFAKQYADSESMYLAQVSKNIIAGGRDSLYRRSFFDALYKGHE